jgi:RES domain-containing protein
MVTIEAPDSFAEISADRLPDKWHEYPEQNILKQIGNNFLKDGKYLFLKVPSALVQEEYNFLLNPTHAKASQVKIKNIKPFSFDARLLD